MKLSDAIRLGSLLKPQARGLLVTRNATCAMGAAVEAIGSRVRRIRADEFPTTGRGPAGGSGLVWDIPEAWTDLLDADCPPCQECQRQESKVLRLITHLNDFHEWSRERIADFVATLEPAEPLPEPEPLPPAQQQEVARG